jgi:hypothetical protein
MKGLESQGLVVLFANELGDMSRVVYDLSGSRTNLLFGLDPAGSYEIRVNGSRVTTRQASVHGTLEFVNSTSGTIEVVLR